MSQAIKKKSIFKGTVSTSLNVLSGNTFIIYIIYNKLFIYYLLNICNIMDKTLEPSAVPHSLKHEM